MTSGSGCFHALGPIGYARGPLFPAEYAQSFFSIFATYFHILSVSRKRKSAKWELSIRNVTYTLTFSYTTVFKEVSLLPCVLVFEYKYIWRDINISSVAGMVERAARIILII